MPMIDAFLKANQKLCDYHPDGKHPIQKKISNWNQYKKSQHQDGSFKFGKGLKNDCPIELEAPMAYSFLRSLGFVYNK